MASKRSQISAKPENPVLAYWAEIESGRIAASEAVRAVYKKLAADIETPRDNWIYDERRAEHAVAFIERYCKHSKGKWGGKPVLLELWQKALIAAAFGFVDVITGLRKHTEILLIVGRKNGKSTLAAAVGLYLMIADGEMGAEVYCAATKRDQAKIIWLESKRMVNKSPVLRRRIKPLVAELAGLGDYDGCVMKPLGSDSETQDGLNVHGGLLDEIHAWPGMELYNVIVDGTSSREQPMMFITTTAGTVREGLYDEKYAYAKNVVLGIEGFQDERLLAAIYELDSHEEWRDESSWAKANPGLGTIKNQKILAEKVNKAKANPRLVPNLLCKDFDLRATENNAWLSFEQIDNPAVFDPKDLGKSIAIGGCDLSSTTDLTCATLIVRKPDDPMVYVLQQYFIPDKRVEEVEAMGKTTEAPYRTWAKRGLVTICPGNQVDYAEVTKWFCMMRDVYNIRPAWIGFDRAFAGYWLDDMDAHGFIYMGKEHPGNVMIRVAQGPFTWSQPLKEMGAALAAHRVNYNNNPVTKWNLSNTCIKSRNPDGIESIQPVKLHEKLRIDGTVSLLNAWVVYTTKYDEYMHYVR